MTFGAWSIIAKPGDMSLKGMLHTARMRRLCANPFTAWIMFLIGWCIDAYLFKLNRLLWRIKVFLKGWTR